MTDTAVAALATGFQNEPAPSAQRNHPLSVVFATPTLCQPADEYLDSMIRTLALCGRERIPVEMIKTFNKTFIGVARDTLVTQFLTNPALQKFENIFWLDDDIGWPAEKVLEFLAAPEPILAGVPPLKRETLRERLRILFAGYRDEESLSFTEAEELLRGTDALERAAMEFPWNPIMMDLPSPDSSPEPLQVFKSNERGMAAAKRVPFGFVRIKRSALMQIINGMQSQNDGRYPAYVEEGKNTTTPQGQPIMVMFPDGPDHQHVARGEDYAFCEIARHFGVEIWVDPDIEFSHRGSYAFKGRLADTL